MFGEKAAERDALRASDVMSELKLRPPNPYEEKCGKGARPRGTSKTAPFTKRRVRHPQKISVHFGAVEGLAARRKDSG